MGPGNMGWIDVFFGGMVVLLLLLSWNWKLMSQSVRQWRDSRRRERQGDLPQRKDWENAGQ